MKAPRVVPIGRITTGVLPFSSRGQPQATIVAKATFALTASSAMQRIPAEGVILRDEAREKNPTKSLLHASELIPYLSQGELRLHGSVHVPRGQQTMVGLVAGRSTQTLVAKYMRVHPPLGRPPADVAGEIVEVPLVYELAYGKPGFAPNPVGTTKPTILHSTTDDAPIGFGPIARLWRARGDLLRPADRAALNKRIPELSEGFQLEFFQAVPHDQRIQGFFTGTEYLVLERLLPGTERAQTWLPGVRALAILSVAGARPRRLHMQADILSINLDKKTCSLLFRTVVPLVGMERTRPIIAVGIASDNEPVDWDSVDFAPPSEGGVPSSKEAPRDDDSPNQTAAIHINALNADTLPFGSSAAAVGARPIQAAPATPFDLTAPDGGPSQSPALPFQGGKPGRSGAASPSWGAVRNQNPAPAIAANPLQAETLGPGVKVPSPIAPSSPPAFVPPAAVPAPAPVPLAVPALVPPSPQTGGSASSAPPSAPPPSAPLSPPVSAPMVGSSGPVTVPPGLAAEFLRLIVQKKQR